MELVNRVDDDDDDDVAADEFVKLILFMCEPCSVEYELLLLLFLLIFDDALLFVLISTVPIKVYHPLS